MWISEIRRRNTMTMKFLCFTLASTSAFGGSIVGSMVTRLTRVSCLVKLRLESSVSSSNDHHTLYQMMKIVILIRLLRLECVWSWNFSTSSAAVSADHSAILSLKRLNFPNPEKFIECDMLKKKKNRENVSFSSGAKWGARSFLSFASTW